jgi:glyceraldehyde-3-phosphate dehydrogenase/erythrose-4-phosphate dehydrogenase
MAIRVAIVGFGYAGRNAIRTLMENPEIDIVVINDEHSPELLASLLKNDIDKEDITVIYDNKSITLNNKVIPILNNYQFESFDKNGIDAVINGTFADKSTVVIPKIIQFDSRRALSNENNGYNKKYRNKYKY